MNKQTNSPTYTIFRQDIKLAFTKGSGLGNIFIFYIMVSVLFIFGIGPERSNTILIAPAVIWVCALLTQIISLQRIFQEDYEDGTLEQLLLTGILPEKIVIARILSNWVSTGLPIIISSPVIGILFGLNGTLILYMAIALLIGTCILSAISTGLAALTIGIKKANAVFGIIALPIYIPVLIYGASWITNPEYFFTNALLLLCMLLFILPVSVMVAVAAINSVMV